LVQNGNTLILSAANTSAGEWDRTRVDSSSTQSWRERFRILIDDPYIGRFALTAAIPDLQLREAHDDRGIDQEFRQ
jgi:hypothetical protein